MNVTKREAAKWVNELTKAQMKADQPSKEQILKPISSADDDNKEISHKRRADISYSLNECELIVNELIKVISNDQNDRGIRVRGMTNKMDIQTFKQSAINLMHQCGPNV